ncbi:MAG: crosslink repair DNA glycosylase YcaQ family protein [Acidobacteriota bacterium]|nr:crosslink repair DNA glycosylase YcaQ family protein [Acidobacteriota bacterium]
MLRIDRETAARFLTAHHNLNQFCFEPTREGVHGLLRRLRCLQLDPLSPMGTSPDMVGMARIRGFKAGDWHRFLVPGLAFEHWAKERCLLPDHAFPYYRDFAPSVKWARMKTHKQRVPAEVIADVLAEVRERGPLAPKEFQDRGAVEPLDWSGWKGTGKMTTMALEILWTHCEVVVAGRRKREKVYDVPERAMKHVFDQPGGDFQRFALLERVEAAGLLNHNTGPHWSTIDKVRKSDLPHELAEEGLIVEVEIEGDKRRYWAPADFLERPVPETDQHMRILGPLDPFLWDRKLIQHVFGFEYIWEVYKPADQRRWGWYVCPLLHKGRLVGRLEGRIQDNCLQVHNLWSEPKTRINRTALKAALKRHTKACGAETFSLPDRVS